jgi:hypothetical protein
MVLGTLVAGIITVWLANDIGTTKNSRPYDQQLRMDGDGACVMTKMAEANSTIRLSVIF